MPIAKNSFLCSCFFNCRGQNQKQRACGRSLHRASPECRQAGVCRHFRRSPERGKGRHSPTKLSCSHPRNGDARGFAAKTSHGCREAGCISLSQGGLARPLMHVGSAPKPFYNIIIIYNIIIYSIVCYIIPSKHNLTTTNNILCEVVFYEAIISIHV